MHQFEIHRLLKKYLQVDPNKEILLDISSTSSDSDTTYLTPLTEMRKTELKEKENAVTKDPIVASQTKRRKHKKKEKSKKKKRKA